MSACLFIDIPSEWEKVMTWSIATLQGKGLQANLGKLCLGACMHSSSLATKNYFGAQQQFEN
jgi:hypothetical protein